MWIYRNLIGNWPYLILRTDTMLFSLHLCLKKAGRQVGRQERMIDSEIGKARTHWKTWGWTRTHKIDWNLWLSLTNSKLKTLMMWVTLWKIWCPLSWSKTQMGPRSWKSYWGASRHQRHFGLLATASLTSR